MITRIVIKNFRGIEFLDTAVDAGGVVARGRCGSGKTSVLRAVQAALGAQDIGPDAIRIGADKAEILVDLDDLSVRRAITAKNSTLSVMKGEFKAPKPQAYLAELLGTSPLDPMDLLTLKAKDRRKKILEALPIAVTYEQMLKWVPTLSKTYDLSGHGLEVVEKLRAKAYEARTVANKTEKDATAEADRLFDVALKAAEAAPESAPDVEAAREHHDTVRAELAALRARKEESEKAEARTADTRAQVQNLRTLAASIEANAGLIHTLGEIDNERSKWDDSIVQVETLTRQLRYAEERACNLSLSVKKMEQDNQHRGEQLQRAAQTTAQADALEAAVSLASVAPVAAEDLNTALLAENEAFTALKTAESKAEDYQVAVKSKELAEAARLKAVAAEAEADKLDKLVKSLSDDAPKELLANSAGIPGLTLDGDDVRLDGISLDGLCGAEQIRFAVEVAKRANAKTKLLIVDGLERLDPVSYAGFITHATADGWQLLASRVDAGDIVLEAIGVERAEAAE